MFIKKIRENDNRTIILFGFIKIKYKKHYSYKKLKQKNIELQRSLNYLRGHINPADIKPATGILRKYQLELLDFADEFCKKVGIKPILFAGNMLGAVRNHGFIPWDDDMDFLLIRSDYEKVISWCQEHGVICYWHDKLSTYKAGQYWKLLEQRAHDYPDKYVLDVWVDQIKLSKGSDFEHQIFIDFFSLDFYKEDYSFDEHRKYMENLKQKIKKIDYRDKATYFVREELNKNTNVSKIKTNKVYYGIDSIYPKPWNTDFLTYDSLYPLKKVRFENKSFYLPNNVNLWLDLNYVNWNQIPNDVGFSHHLYYKDLYLKQKKQ